MGHTYAAQIDTQLPIIRDAQINQYINALGQSLAKGADTRALTWHFANLPLCSTTTYYIAAVDAAGNVVVAGTTFNAGTSGDFTVVKFDGLTGAELWRQVLNGTGNGFDSAIAVAIDAAGNVAAVGSIGSALSDATEGELPPLLGEKVEAPWFNVPPPPQQETPPQPGPQGQAVNGATKP